MKKIKKLFAAILAASMIFTFASCNQDVPEEPSTKSSSTANANGGGNDDGSNGADNTGDYTTTPVVMKAGTTGSAGPDATYVLFGEWPQTLIKSDVTVDENECKTVGAFTYYKGSDGSWYVKCLENAYEADYTYEETDTKVGQGSTTSKYFKVEPIKWRVVDTTYDYDGTTGTDTAKLLVAESILTANVPYYESTSTRTISGTVYPNNYMHSQIRAYLNGISYTAASAANNDKWLNQGFLQSAFTATAQQKIKTTTVKNDGLSTTDVEMNITRADGKSEDGSTSSEYPVYTCADTEDKIFLLSEYEVTKYSTEAYDDGGAGNSRIRKTTDYAKANYASYQDGCGGYWWLRSPSYSFCYCARCVDYDGYANISSIVNFTNRGVVPALSISF